MFLREGAGFESDYPGILYTELAYRLGGGARSFANLFLDLEEGIST
jgi:hypothetical protein